MYDDMNTKRKEWEDAQMSKGEEAKPYNLKKHTFHL